MLSPNLNQGSRREDRNNARGYYLKKRTRSTVVVGANSPATKPHHVLPLNHSPASTRSTLSCCDDALVASVVEQNRQKPGSLMLSHDIQLHSPSPKTTGKQHPPGSFLHAAHQGFCGMLSLHRGRPSPHRSPQQTGPHNPCQSSRADDLKRVGVGEPLPACKRTRDDAEFVTLHNLEKFSCRPHLFYDDEGIRFSARNPKGDGAIDMHDKG